MSAGDPEARRRKRRERLERRLEPMLPEPPRPGYSQINSKGARMAGSATADKVLRFAFGFAAGMAVCGQLVATLSGREVDGSEGLLAVPIVRWAVFGMVFGVMFSPVALGMTRGQKQPKFLLRGGFVGGFVAAMFFAMIPV